MHELRRAFRELSQGDGKQTRLTVTLLSFGYKYGVPAESDLLFDVRFLPNPHFVTGLRQLTGKDQAVRDYLAGHRRECEARRRGDAGAGGHSTRGSPGSGAISPTPGWRPSRFECSTGGAAPGATLTVTAALRPGEPCDPAAMTRAAGRPLAGAVAGRRPGRPRRVPGTSVTRLRSTSALADSGLPA